MERVNMEAYNICPYWCGLVSYELFWMISGFIIRYLIRSEESEFVGLEY